MAFFDEMKNKLTATSQSAVQKAKDLTETTRLNSQVNETEKEISALYRQLGFVIYQAHRDDPIPEGAELIARISELHGKVEELKAQIQNVNRASLCPTCGARISKGMVFCTNCGSKLPAVEEAPREEKKAARCTACGAALEEGSLFCTKCGTKVSGAAEAPRVEKKITCCTACGTVLEEGSLFCTSCGTRVATES